MTNKTGKAVTISVQNIKGKRDEADLQKAIDFFNYSI